LAGIPVGPEPPSAGGVSRGAPGISEFIGTGRNKKTPYYPNSVELLVRPNQSFLERGRRFSVSAEAIMSSFATIRALNSKNIPSMVIIALLLAVAGSLAFGWR